MVSLSVRLSFKEELVKFWFFIIYDLESDVQPEFVLFIEYN